MADHPPRRPAAAYTVMAELLDRINPGWAQRPPSRVGVDTVPTTELTVTSRYDNVATVWELPTADVSGIAGHARRAGLITRPGAHPSTW